jgi:hypothetical protein
MRFASDSLAILDGRGSARIRPVAGRSVLRPPPDIAAIVIESSPGGEAPAGTNAEMAVSAKALGIDRLNVAGVVCQ